MILTGAPIKENYLLTNPGPCSGHMEVIQCDEMATDTDGIEPEACIAGIPEAVHHRQQQLSERRTWAQAQSDCSIIE